MIKLFYFLFLFSFYASANCELISFGYHTIATYEDSPKHLVFSRYIFNDPYLTVLKSLKKGDSYSSRDPKPIEFNIKMASINGDEECIKSEKTEEFSSAFSGHTFIRFPICKNKAPPEVGNEGYAIADSILQKVSFPKRLIGSEITIKNAKTTIIEKNIDTFLKNHEFKANRNITLPPGQIKSKSFKHIMFNDHFYSTTVEILNKSDKTYFAVFLTNNDVSWYIADSAGLESCEGESKDLSQISKIGWIANVHEGFDYNNDGMPDIIKFDEPDVFYYLEFGKLFHVIENLDERVSMSWGPEIGFGAPKPPTKTPNK